MKSTGRNAQVLAGRREIMGFRDLMQVSKRRDDILAELAGTDKSPVDAFMGMMLQLGIIVQTGDTKQEVVKVIDADSYRELPC